MLSPYTHLSNPIAIGVSLCTKETVREPNYFHFHFQIPSKAIEFQGQGKSLTVIHSWNEAITVYMQTCNKHVGKYIEISAQNMAEYESLNIEVTGINKDTSKDTLDNYFSSSRRGGDITNIEYIQGSGNALITFANAEGRKTRLSVFVCYCWLFVSGQDGILQSMSETLIFIGARNHSLKYTQHYNTIMNEFTENALVPL